MGKSAKIGSELQERGLKDVVYTGMMGMSQDQKSKLPPRLKKHFKSPGAAKRFVEKSTFEQKREMLQHFEISSFLVLCPNGYMGVKKFLEVYGEFDNKLKADGLKKAAESGIYVTSDTEFEYTLGNLAQNLTSIPYQKHLELQRVGSAFKKWSRKVNSTAEDDVEYFAQVIAKTMLWATMFFEKSDSVVNLDVHILKLLFYFYSTRTKYNSIDDVEYFFEGFLSKTKIREGLKKLIELNMIQKTFDWRKKEYTITKVGIRTVNQFRDRVFKSYNF